MLNNTLLQDFQSAIFLETLSLDSPFDRFCHEGRTQLSLQAGNTKGEFCVTVANPGWEEVFLQ